MRRGPRRADAARAERPPAHGAQRGDASLQRDGAPPPPRARRAAPRRADRSVRGHAGSACHHAGRTHHHAGGALCPVRRARLSLRC
eukprot:6131094-Prymnesium_polylepis.1